jgi:alkylation response protein AidB-like acyl-CoA dehydrogenase
MSAVQADNTTTTGPELVARARALTPLLAENALQAEKQRKPVDAVIKALEEAEIYKLMVPKCYGGLELDLDTFFDVGVALGEGMRPSPGYRISMSSITGF